MTKSRTWWAGTALVVVLVLVAGYFLVISPKRSDATSLHAQAVSLVAQNASTEQNIAELKVEQQQLPSQQAQLAAIQQQIPNQPLLPSLLRQISSTAYDANVGLGAVSPSSTITPVPGDSGVSFIPVSVTVVGNFKDIKAFLLALENNKRAVLVYGYTIAPATQTGSNPLPAGTLTMQMQTRVFMTTGGTGTAAAPATSTGTTGAVAATPTPSSSTTPTAPSAATGSSN